MTKMIKLYLSGLLLLATTVAQADTIDLHVMGGQSNMQGWRSDAQSYPYDYLYKPRSNLTHPLETRRVTVFDGR